MFELGEFLAIALPPSDLNSEWLQGAMAGVDYLVKQARAEEIVLFTNAGQSLVHAVLVPSSNVTPANGSELQYARIDPYSHWALEHVSGGGEPDRMYLASPCDAYGCKSLSSAQQLVFRRYFADVDKGPPRTELSQPLVQALDLYWLDEFSAYCRLNEDGDIEPIIWVRELGAETGDDATVLVTIESEQLHRYMAVTGTALVMKFDFTRYPSGSFTGWTDLTREEVNETDLFFHSGIQARGSFVNGALIIRPLLTKEMLIAKAKRERARADKQYAVFKAWDWKNKKRAEISSAPSALASYFDTGSALPFQTTPAFFKPEVLQKYKADPEKYQLEHRSIYARGGWHLKSYDVNDAGQVHAYLYDLANLPYSEQLYWQSFNEWPKSGISERAFQTDFEGSFSTVADPLVGIKYEISKIDESKPSWWNPRGKSVASALHYPVTASPEEWSNALLALDQFVVEGFVVKELRSRLSTAGKTAEKSWGSLRLLQECLLLSGLDESEAIAVVEPLKKTHAFRSKVKGHLAESEKQAIIKQARIEYGSLAKHFLKLAEDVQVSFDRIVELL